MITALYAVGPNGEFGLRGKLPWGSFREELDAFYSQLDVLNPDNIIIGAGTYLALPEVVRQRMIGESDLFIRADRPLPDDIKHGIYTPISKIGDTLPTFLKDQQTVVLGGATLLYEMYIHGHIESAFVSTIFSTQKLEADVYLDNTILDYNYESTRLVYATGANSDNSLRFVQELVTY
ncbi:putative dihydrofolate reductase [Escherichia phage Lindwurm]|uniref:Dihydrofolate reductase n=1 Tax=Escherichia phage Lindwurm TaxID=2872674 RepID=A0AC61TN30_9CAUD|nr:putative dihydrofolate reductase [Escherichia phage Lindwurm]